MPPMNTLTFSRESDTVEHHELHTVLVVEDEMMVRMPIAEYLRDCGYNVLEAADASEAIAAMDAEGPVSLVFSDIRMPGKMDGFGLAEWFSRTIPRCRSADLGLQWRTTFARRVDARNRFIEKPYSQTQVAPIAACSILKRH